MKKVLVFGGKGGLGSSVVTHFASKGWWVVSADLSENGDAAGNVVIDRSDDWTTQEAHVLKRLRQLVKGDDKFDSILNMAGGWAGGSASSGDFIKNADLMWKQSVWSASIAARAASEFLAPDGLLVLPGAQPATKGTPGMIGYGMAKAAVHQLTRSLACEKSGLPKGAQTFALLPITLDTPMNRKFMPKADTSAWTPLTFVSELLFGWSDDKAKRPAANGSLVQLVTKEGKTELKMVDLP